MRSMTNIQLGLRSVLCWNPLDVVDHHHQDRDLSRLQPQSQRLPDGGKEVGCRSVGKVGIWLCGWVSFSVRPRSFECRIRRPGEVDVVCSCEPGEVLHRTVPTARKITGKPYHGHGRFDPASPAPACILAEI